MLSFFLRVKNRTKKVFLCLPYICSLHKAHTGKQTFSKKIVKKDNNLQKISYLFLSLKHFLYFLYFCILCINDFFVYLFQGFRIKKKKVFSVAIHLDILRLMLNFV